MCVGALRSVGRRLSPLALAALDALGQAGGGNLEDAVVRIAQDCLCEPVRQRAAEILPILIARRKREASSASLLRPSQADAINHLLRPVSSSEPNIDNLLLASQRDSRDKS